MKTKIIFILIIIFASQLYAQNNVLDEYIKEGLKGNLALKQKQSSYEKSIQALKEAKGMFLPNLSLNARYSVADGGRVIEFPVGDMLNPVYNTLNQLTSTNQFSQIENEEIQFMRPTEHETKLRLIQPIFNPQIHFNSKIKHELTNVEKADVESYKRQLIAEIKTAYYNYLKTIHVLELTNKTTELLKENIRVNEKLYANDKVTIDNVYRSKAELSKLEQNIAEAVKYNKSSKAYFNFLLNKPLESDIEISGETKLSIVDTELQNSQENAINNREELFMLKSYASANNYNLKMNKFNKAPNLTAVIDYGFQGEKYNFTSDDDFIMASFVLSWDLFKGFQNNAKIQQALIDKQIIDTKHNETVNQIKLQVINIYYEIEAATKAITAAKQQVLSAKKSFNIINKKYKEGQANLLQFIDARTTMTNAEHNVIITTYDYKIKYAEFERVACLYDIVE
ncbi:MAG: TolC family protein [Bacteroidales bacterium]|nr:TolC family protein [Bacteroidales bacterium]